MYGVQKKTSGRAASTILVLNEHNHVYKNKQGCCKPGLYFVYSYDLLHVCIAGFSRAKKKKGQQNENV